jgi:hypothetical protein
MSAAREFPMSPLQRYFLKTSIPRSPRSPTPLPFPSFISALPRALFPLNAIQTCAIVAGCSSSIVALVLSAARHSAHFDDERISLLGLFVIMFLLTLFLVISILSGVFECLTANVIVVIYAYIVPRKSNALRVKRRVAFPVRCCGPSGIEATYQLAWQVSELLL